MATTVGRVTTPETTEPSEDLTDERADGERLYDKAFAIDVHAGAPADQLAQAQLLVLQAIYRELRNGHDQAVRQSAALTDHAKALHEHADAMDSLRGALMEHADSISRYRGSER